ncbi:ketosteroid isomerase-like protein [Bradyrhizobium ottawaense]
MTVEKLNRQRVLHLLDAFARGDLEAALACCTDDVDFLTHAPIDVLPHMVPRHGKQELRELWQTVWSRYSEIRYKAPHILAEGEAVATYMQAYFRKRSNDRIVQFDMAVFYTFRGGLVAGDPRDHRFLRSGAAGAGARDRAADRGCTGGLSLLLPWNPHAIRRDPGDYGVLLQISQIAINCALRKRELRFGRNRVFYSYTNELSPTA